MKQEQVQLTHVEESRMLNIIVYYYIVIQLLLAFSQGKFLQRKLFCLKLSQDSLN